MKKLALGLMAAAAAAVPAFAHHSGAMYEAQKSMNVDATVKEFQWTNPHTWLQVNIPNAKGGTDEWSLELGPLVGLSRAGWKPKTLQPGDKVKVLFHPMRDGTFAGKFQSVTMADGKILTERGPPEPGEAAPR